MAVTALAPLQVVGGTILDTYRTHADNPKTIWVSPLILFHNGLKHFGICAIHAADIVLYPIHVIGDDEPLDLYVFRGFPFRVEPELDAKIAVVMPRVIFMGAVGGAVVVSVGYSISLINEYGWLSWSAGRRSIMLDLAMFLPLAVALPVGRMIDEDWTDRVLDN